MAPPVPSAIRAEANRAPVALPPPGAVADNNVTMKLVRDLRKSELRYKRAAVAAVDHSDKTRAPKAAK